MGEVYRARDTRLDRAVAVKVLPQQIATSPESRQRFEREARTISQLSHPHICALYDVGREGEVDYLVMELLEGETLSARLAKGPLPLEQTLRAGQEIADALDKAHRQGIVHRDLKPGNVMLTKSGVKLLDFGLAKAIPPPAEPGSLTSLPTQHNLTREGTILGTFQYMAPEQLEGRDADARTDIFAMGAVLYEMSTGKKAFSGASQASLITAIMSAEPPSISATLPMSPPALDRVVRTCLAKDPEDRWQSAADAKRELRWIAEGSAAGFAAPSSTGQRPRRSAAAVAGFLGALLAGLAMWWALGRRPPADSPRPVWLSVLVPTDAPIASYGAQRIAFSPDGFRMAYASEQGGTTRLYLRAFDRPESVPVRDSDGAISPFFSADSRWLGYFLGTRLVKVPVDGGAPQTICEAGEVRGASWGSDGMIVYSTGTSGLRRVPASGGASELLITPDNKKGEVAFYWPQILPGNDTVLFGSFAGRPHVSLLSLKTRKRIDLTEGDGPSYSLTGHILFTRGSSLFAVPFDPSRLELTGPAIALLDGVKSLAPFRSPLFAISNSGVLAYVPGSSPVHRLVWVDREGKIEPLNVEPRDYEEPRLSPDGKRVAVTIRGDNPDIWVLDLTRGSAARLTFDDGEDETPAWTPDGARVTFSADRIGKSRAVYSRPFDGSGSEDALFDGDPHPHVNAWAPDGRSLVYTEFDPGFSGDLWVFTPGEKPATRVWLRTPYNERGGRLSPDGRWIAYTSNESGRDEIYVRPFPGPGGKWQVSVAGGTEPVWAHGGAEIFYRTGDKMMAARVTRDGAFAADTPRQLFAGPFVPTRRGEAAYDISLDDKRFLMVRRDDQSVATHIDVILNFAEELRRRASATGRP
jgi:Tol biopolymer transport system component